MSSTKCRKCGKEVTIKEASKHNGLCEECYDSNDDSYYPINKYAVIIKFLAISGGIIGSLIGFCNENYILLGISVISAIFISALGEIVQLLEDIKNK